jgi:uncharacterized protein YbcV (DUF1398 family)
MLPKRPGLNKHVNGIFRFEIHIKDSSCTYYENIKVTITLEPGNRY